MFRLLLVLVEYLLFGGIVSLWTMVDPEFADKIEELEHIAIFGFDGTFALNVCHNHYFNKLYTNN